MEVKNNYAHVTIQRILNKFIEINFSFGCMVWPWCCLFQDLLPVKYWWDMLNTAFPVVPKRVEIIQTHPNPDLLLEGPGLIGLMSIYFICGRRRLTLPSTICFSACMQLVHSESLVCSENLWMPFHLKGKVDPCQV